MHRYLCFLLLFLILGSNSFGQVPENINTDRPDQSDGTYIVSKNIFQLETGLVFSADGIIHNTMLRYGIVKNTELRLLFNYGEVNTTGKRETGIFPVSFSIKHKLVEGKRFIPQITAVGYVQFPFLSTTNFKTDKTSYTFLLAFQNDLSPVLSLGYNAGILFDASTQNPAAISTASLGYTISKKSSLFFEYFAQFPKKDNPGHNIDFGYQYLLKHNIQLDLALGTTVFNPEHSRFLTCGFSYNFKK